MIFTDLEFLFFYVGLFTLYWVISNKTAQNILLLIGSYVFYGWVHPWFCLLIAASTVTDYVCGLKIKSSSHHKRWLVISLIVNLGLLGVFKYFNFFVDNFHDLLSTFGISANKMTLRIFLPVGISFYTFQTLSYTIDIYKGKLEPRKNLLDFAVFVAFFPQLVAGPIERASRLLPQVESRRKFNLDQFIEAWPLLIFGYFKKLVIADNISIYVDKIFMLESPTLLLLITGTLGFALQILADFSAYTDIARACSKMLGFELMENFKSPYMAISPSDFWRRWHISLSSWIRDYLYIPLGGSRVGSNLKFFYVVMTTMTLAGLWHGASWHFVIWGMYHGLLLFCYHKLGFGGKWQPTRIYTKIAAWGLMFTFTNIGWLLFRTPSMGWLAKVISNSPGFGIDEFPMLASIQILAMTGFFWLWLLVMKSMQSGAKWHKPLHAIVYGTLLVMCIIFYRQQGGDFIYFQF